MERITESDVAIEETIYKQPGKVEVFKVRLYRTNENLCMKKIYVENVNDATLMQQECLAMAYFDHENILRLRSALLGGYDRAITHVTIFMDYFREGDLEKLISDRVARKQPFSEEELLGYLAQLISAYAYLQEKNVAHRDVKPQNIFVTGNGKILKVGDLGSATRKDGQATSTLMGTPLYLSPKLRQEFLNSNAGGSNVNHNVFKSDVFSLGLTFLYMASLVQVKDLATLDDLRFKIANRISSLPDCYNNLKKILEKMLDVNENARLDFIDLKKFMSVKKTEKVILTRENLTKSSAYKILEFSECCSICDSQKNEENLYVFTSGLICDECYEETKKTLYKPDSM